MKTIYLVRHGESDNNATGRYNSPDSGLSASGREQAMHIAKRCEKLPIDVIISSEIIRAKDTATTIASHMGKELEFSDFFTERKLPSSLQGKERKAPEVSAAIQAIQDNFHTPGYRFEDGENFEDLKTRALAGLKFLENRPEEHILVVTHGFFLTILAAAVIFGEKLTSEECMAMMRGLQVMRNTGLSILRFDDHTGQGLDGLESPWQLRVWNDHAHLG